MMTDNTSPPDPAQSRPQGPRPIRYSAEEAAPLLRAAAAKPQPAAEDTSGPENGPQIDAAPSEDTTAGADIGAPFVDAFKPPQAEDDDGGGFTPEDYEALVAEFDSADEQPGDDDVDVAHGQHIGDSDEEPEPASRREARYRAQLRDTEARLQAVTDENAKLHEELDAVRRSQAVALAAGRLADPSGDLFRDHGLDEVLADDGTVDPQRVNELADAVLAEHPHYGTPRPVINPNALRSGAAKADGTAPPSWQRAFAPRPK
jgi:hypothetical protein